MVLAGYLVELIFTPLRLIPSQPGPQNRDHINQLGLHHVAEHRFPRRRRGAADRLASSGSIPMLREMGGAPDNAVDDASGPVNDRRSS